MIKNEIDWPLTSWEGSRREQYRRWSKLSLREILLSQEEMQELSDRFQKQRKKRNLPLIDIDHI